MPSTRIDHFLSTIFGMYISPKAVAQTKTNIEKLGPYIWTAASHSRKLEIGAKFGVYRKNGAIHSKDAVESFLVSVNGLSFKDEDSLAGELLEKLENLRRAHFGNNNFYNEYPHAQSLLTSLPPNGVVPEAARQKWVKTISICYVGNGLGYREGVDENALVYYEQFMSNFLSKN